MRQKFPAVGDFREKALQCRFRVTVLRNDGIRREIVRQRRGLFEKERQVVFNPRGRQTFAHILVDRAFVGVARERLAPRRPKACLGFGVHRKFVARQHADFINGIRGALCLGVKAADVVDFVVKEIKSEGGRRTHGKDVDDAAPNAEFARSHHLFDVTVAGGDQVLF